MADSQVTTTVANGNTTVPNVQPVTTSPSSLSGYVDPDANANASDLSDFSQSTGGVIPQLPIRGEKQIIPIVAPSAAAFTAGKNHMSASSFYIAAAKKAFKDYIQVSIPHRGFDSSGKPDKTKSAEFRFLINPATVQVNRETIDQQALTRGGWQFGVWGEGLTRISMSGTTAGDYFALGLTDEFSYFTKSYRNLMALTSFYESNGYFWEGEGAFTGVLTGDSRRNIKCHQDVQLTIGNFIWSGMFDTFSVRLDAEKPFQAMFELSFIAWKERFRASSPYPNSFFAAGAQRGHSYDAFYTHAAVDPVYENNVSISDATDATMASLPAIAYTTPPAVAAAKVTVTNPSPGAITATAVKNIPGFTPGISGAPSNPNNNVVGNYYSTGGNGGVFIPGSPGTPGTPGSTD